MKTYAIVEITVTDRAWVDDYLVNVTRMVHEHGGQYLSRTSKIEQTEGDGVLPQVVAIIEFPSREAANEFYTSEEYQPYLERRKNGSNSRILMVAGEDFAQR